jgi:hypothetical protein
MSDNNNAVASNERRQKLQALREKRKEQSAAEGSDNAGKGKPLGKILKAVAKRRRQNQQGGEAQAPQAGGGRGGKRLLGRALKNRKAGGEGGKRKLEDFPRLKEFVEKRKDKEELPKIERLESRAAKLKEALIKTKQEIEDAKKTETEEEVTNS